MTRQLQHNFSVWQEVLEREEEQLLKTQMARLEQQEEHNDSSSLYAHLTVSTQSSQEDTSTVPTHQDYSRRASDGSNETYTSQSSAQDVSSRARSSTESTDTVTF